MLHLSSEAALFAKSAVLICGTARSGTTLVGNIIHSMKSVEYAYEPPTLVLLLALINNINEHNWKLLYEAYLYEEFFLNALAGRAINCNTTDDSSIYKVKPTAEIESRLRTHASKQLLQQRSLGSIIAFKIPSPHLIPKLKEYYPSMRVVVVTRDAIDTINSLIAKKWFSKEAEKFDLIWPFSIIDGIHIPYFVKVCDQKDWIAMSELDRAAYYYIRSCEYESSIDGKIEVNYSVLMQNPLNEVERIAELLGLKFGEMTHSIIGGIARKDIPRNSQILSGIRGDLREKVLYHSSQCE